MWYFETPTCFCMIKLALYTIVFTTVLLAVVKLYNWMTTGVYRGTRSMKGKTVIVTGCNSGNDNVYSIRLLIKYLNSYRIFKIVFLYYYFYIRNRKRNG